MKYLVVLLISLSICAVGESQSDREMKLQAIYTQHSNLSASFGDPVKSLAEQSCADLHAKAAESILEHPAKAIAIEKQAKMGCENLLETARIENAVLSRTKLINECKQFSGQPYEDWPARCEKVSAGLREFIKKNSIN
jgi:hypothetical protein